MVVLVGYTFPSARKKEKEKPAICGIETGRNEAQDQLESWMDPSNMLFFGSLVGCWKVEWDRSKWNRLVGSEVEPRFEAKRWKTEPSTSWPRMPNERGEISLRSQNFPCED